jgi:DNA-binding beta-propeller fold protein YncE
MRSDALALLVLLSLGLGGCPASPLAPQRTDSTATTDSDQAGSDAVAEDDAAQSRDASEDAALDDAAPSADADAALDASTPRDARVAADAAASPDSGVVTSAQLFVTSDDGTLYAFEVGTWTLVSQWSGLPFGDGVRGIDADPQAGVLYVAHGGDSTSSSGSLFAWDLSSHSARYDVRFAHGIDQLALGGGRIYMPAGEIASSQSWYVLDASDGSQLGVETGGLGPHNTIYQNGHRYYGGRLSSYLSVQGIGAGQIGPSPSGETGVRPFTLNALETRVWITWTRYRGFSIGDLASGAIITSVEFGPIPAGYSPTAASHGISLSPDGTELYVLDTPYNAVRVYDGTDQPNLIANVPLAHPIFPGDESPCAYDCPRDGWLLHSRDGLFVYVGDSGDIIDTRTRTVTANLAPLANNRHGYIELDYADGALVGTTTHFGRSYR